ncbi:hypothetical protein B0H13DRAFT_2315033 [Mycena leptocephala]|nr:hypothetical protein B0H13DRAFT_2315033 [Mycena leptocephala]
MRYHNMNFRLERRPALIFVGLVYLVLNPYGLIPTPKSAFRVRTGFLYIAMGFGMLGIALTAVAGYSAIAKISHRNRNHDSEPPPYSFFTHASQFLPYVAMLLGSAVSLHEKGTPFLPGVLEKFGTVFGLLFIPPLLSIGIMFLTIKKLHLAFQYGRGAPRPGPPIPVASVTRGPFLILPSFWPLSYLIQ